MAVTTGRLYGWLPVASKVFGWLWLTTKQLAAAADGGGYGVYCVEF